MSKTIKPDQLAKEIEQALADFAGVTEEACEKGVSETADEAVQALRNAHPAGSGDYGSWDKRYNKGWKVMQTKTDKRYHRKATIHNATDYQLTHLLEKPHSTGGGGHYPSPSGGKDHTGIIARIEEKQVNDFIEEVMKKL